MGMIIGGALGAFGAMSAADTQASAARDAANKQTAAGQQAVGYLQSGLGQSQAALQPYVNNGQTYAGALNSNLNYLTTPYAPTMAQLQATPGYQFTLGQGLNATQNAMTAMGLGRSGAAAKAAANYATGLADNTYMNQAQLYEQQQGQIGNLLTSLNSTGLAAAGNLANTDYNYNAAMGNALTGQANQAAQTNLAGATAGASGIMGATNSLTNALQYNALMNRGIGSTTGGGFNVGNLFGGNSWG